MRDNIEAAPEAQDAGIDNETALKGQTADEGYEIFEEGISQSIPQDVSDAVRRKIDRHLLVLMCLLYGLNYVDKVAMGWAVLFDFRKDLGLVGNEYSWASSMFYLLVKLNSANGGEKTADSFQWLSRCAVPCELHAPTLQDCQDPQ